MRFSWDERKNASNLAKHGVSFKRATLVFDDPHAVSIPDDHEAETRWLTIGLVNGVLLLVVIHTVREQHHEEEIRIISARKATRRERETYEQNLAGSSSKE